MVISKGGELLIKPVDLTVNPELNSKAFLTNEEQQ
jgi:hypothetical protein